MVHTICSLIQWDERVADGDPAEQIMHLHCPVSSYIWAQCRIHILALFFTLLLCQYQLSISTRKLKVSYTLLLCQYQLSGHIRSWLHRVPWLCNFLSYCSAARVMEWARLQRIWSQYFWGWTIQFLLKWISKIQQIHRGTETFFTFLVVGPKLVL